MGSRPVRNDSLSPLREQELGSGAPRGISPGVVNLVNYAVEVAYG